jgi:hypothetical protein
MGSSSMMSFRLAAMELGLQKTTTKQPKAGSNRQRARGRERKERARPKTVNTVNTYKYGTWLMTAGITRGSYVVMPVSPVDVYTVVKPSLNF